jgi:putative membrane protein
MLLSRWEPWPLVNVGIVAIHILILLYGYWLIKAKKDESAHKKAMLSAGGVFLVFLTSFLVRVALVGTAPLGSWEFPLQPRHLQAVHAVVAIITVGLVSLTYYLGLTCRYDRHRKIAPWALWLWIITGLFGILGHFLYPRG